MFIKLKQFFLRIYILFKKMNISLKILSILFIFFILFAVFIGIRYVSEGQVSIKNVRITNVAGTSATVTWVSEKPIWGSVIYGESNKWIPVINSIGREKAYDDRDIEEVEYGKYELKEKGKYYIHHVTIRGLNPESKYYYRISTGLKSVDYEYPALETGKELDAVNTPYPVYGSIDNTGLKSGIIVFLRLEDLEVDMEEGDELPKLGLKNSQALSAIVNEEGGWSIDIGNIRYEDLGDVFNKVDFKVYLDVYTRGDILENIEIEKDSIQPVNEIMLMGKESESMNQGNNLLSYLRNTGFVKIVNAQGCAGGSVSACTQICKDGCSGEYKNACKDGCHDACVGLCESGTDEEETVPEDTQPESGTQYISDGSWGGSGDYCYNDDVYDCSSKFSCAFRKDCEKLGGCVKEKAHTPDHCKNGSSGSGGSSDTETNCSDSRDNDKDGKTDCEDNDCKPLVDCKEDNGGSEDTGLSDCSDILNENLNGYRCESGKLLDSTGQRARMQKWCGSGCPSKVGRNDSNKTCCEGQDICKCAGSDIPQEDEVVTDGCEYGSYQAGTLPESCNSLPTCPSSDNQNITCKVGDLSGAIKCKNVNNQTITIQNCKEAAVAEIPIENRFNTGGDYCIDNDLYICASPTNCTFKKDCGEVGCHVMEENTPDVCNEPEEDLSSNINCSQFNTAATKISGYNNRIGCSLPLISFSDGKCVKPTWWYNSDSRSWDKDSAEVKCNPDTEKCVQISDTQIKCELIVQEPGKNCPYENEALITYKGKNACVLIDTFDYNQNSGECKRNIAVWNGSDWQIEVMITNCNPQTEECHDDGGILKCRGKSSLCEAKNDSLNVGGKRYNFSLTSSSLGRYKKKDNKNEIECDWECKVRNVWEGYVDTCNHLQDTDVSVCISCDSNSNCSSYCSQENSWLKSKSIYYKVGGYTCYERKPHYIQSSNNTCVGHYDVITGSNVGLNTTVCYMVDGRDEVRRNPNVEIHPGNCVGKSNSTSILSEPLYSFNIVGGVYGSESNTNEKTINSSGVYYVEGTTISNETGDLTLFVNEETGNLNVRFFEDKNDNGIKDDDETYVDASGISLIKKEDILSYELNIGWNLVSFPIISENIKTAKQLLTYIASNDGYATHVVTYTEGKWQIYSQRGDISYSEDFNILPGKGYFVRVHKETYMSVSGNKFSESLPLDLEVGWNLIGIVSPGKEYTAGSLIDGVVTGGIGADTVTKWDSGMYENYIKEGGLAYGQDFKIFEIGGYFIRVKENSGNFTP